MTQFVIKVNNRQNVNTEWCLTLVPKLCANGFYEIKNSECSDVEITTSKAVCIKVTKTNTACSDDQFNQAYYRNTTGISCTWYVCTNRFPCSYNKLEAFNQITTSKAVCIKVTKTRKDLPWRNCISSYEILRGDS